MKKQWIIKAVPPIEEILSLQEALSINPILCHLLIQRGIKTIEQAKPFFRPTLDMIHDPFEMKGLGIAVERINQAIFNNEKIMIYGDYDVDGTTSVALTYNFLKEFSSNLYTYIPDRYTEGYGISKKSINWAVDHDISLIISLDCGIRNVEEVELAGTNHIDFIICDHHLPGDILPPAVAILDPKQKDCDYPYKELSGCGVGFKMLQGFCIQNGIDEKKLYEWIDLLGVSIACDIVPITGENRVLAHIGIKKLNASPSPGLEALIKKAGLQKPLTISNIVFGLGPRINAAGRVGHAKTALDLLTQTVTQDAHVFAEKLNLENDERKTYDEQITIEALDMIASENPETKKTSVLYKKSWHKGIIGIVASRCIEHYYKPTIILTESNGQLAGSARSVNGFDIYHAIDQCKEYLIQFGGHKYAAGMTMKKSQLAGFKIAFEKAVRETILDKELNPKIDIDLEIQIDEIDYSLYNIMKQIGPFGPGNMQPIFISRGINIHGEGRVLKEKHLKFSIKQSNGEIINVIGFGFADFIDSIGKPFDIAYTIEENHFRGESSLQIMLKDIRA
ncbi:MAG: single-stranded-DNA-specific exonuclease RecJ [Reichenbachiella sp.]